jgi:ribonuclease R
LFWLKFVIEKATTKEFSDLLNKIWDIPEAWKRLFLEKTLLRTLSKAVYTSENVWHFGLWIAYYSHFTSPIRRYPDLQIHRIIKEKISWKLDKTRISYYKNILEDVALQSSEQERKAEKLEYKVRDYFIVKHYKNKVWEIFNWVITTMMPKWFFVQLVDTAEWFVELDNNYIFNDDLQEFRNRKTTSTYMIWDVVNVRLFEADEKLIRLNFELV